MGGRRIRGNISRGIRIRGIRSRRRKRRWRRKLVRKEGENKEFRKKQKDVERPWIHGIVLLKPCIGRKSKAPLPTPPYSSNSSVSYLVMRVLEHYNEILCVCTGVVTPGVLRSPPSRLP